MSNKFKKLILPALFIMFILNIFSINILTAKATDAYYGLQTAASSSGISDLTISGKTGLDIGADILGIALSFLGIVFFAIVLYAGIKWMTALGEASKAEEAKSMLESAAIGLIIIIAAYALASAVFNYLGIS